MIIKFQRPVAFFVALALLALLQISAMPLRADQAPGQAGVTMASDEQSPSFVEAPSASGNTAKKKNIVPIILIGVGVAALAAVLFLVVLKTKYDVRGTWTVTRSSDFTWIINPRTFVFEGATRDSGTMTISGFADHGPWTLDGKKVSFTVTTNAIVYLWTFTGNFTAKDTISGTLNYRDASHNINGTWTATRTAAAAAEPAPVFASEIKPDRDDR